jgi:hypothetical protein
MNVHDHGKGCRRLKRMEILNMHVAQIVAE